LHHIYTSVTDLSLFEAFGTVVKSAELLQTLLVIVTEFVINVRLVRRTLRSMHGQGTSHLDTTNTKHTNIQGFYKTLRRRMIFFIALLLFMDLAVASCFILQGLTYNSPSFPTHWGVFITGLTLCVLTIHPIISFKFLDIFLHGLQDIKRRRKLALKLVDSPPQPSDEVKEMGVQFPAKKGSYFLATSSASSSYIPEKYTKSNSSCDSLSLANNENFYVTNASESNVMSTSAVELRNVTRGQTGSQLSVDLHIPAAESSLILSQDESMGRGNRQ
jgi:hypothetical protein